MSLVMLRLADVSEQRRASIFKEYLWCWFANRTSYNKL